MKSNAFSVRPAEREPALHVVGCEVTVLASNERTGSYELTLQRGPEGAGPPPHSHPWDETFFVLQGQVDFLLDGQVIRAESGTLLHIPAHTAHGFSFGAGGGQMLELTGNGGGATRMFRAIDAQVPPGAPDVDFLVALLAQHQVKVHAPQTANA